MGLPLRHTLNADFLEGVSLPAFLLLVGVFLFVVVSRQTKNAPLGALCASAVNQVISNTGVTLNGGFNEKIFSDCTSRFADFPKFIL